MSQGHEFTIVQDLYDEVEDAEGTFKLSLIKADMKIKWYCNDLSLITSFQQAYNEKGNMRHQYTKLFVDGGEILAKITYKKAKELLIQNQQQIGFKRK